MATTISVTAFQTVCAECGDAIEAADWGLAATKYAVAEAINAGLEVQLSDSGSSVQRRETLKGLAAAIETACKIVAQTDGQGRFITTRTRHPR
ncbi:MAG TPA: hypothetical protein VM492_05170 [Sumerlaeia bacterium]|nr:hypothetical protein [Sumerlaeia bacterium]